MKLTLTTDDGKVLGIWYIADDEFGPREIRDLVELKLPIVPDKGRTTEKPPALNVNLRRTST